MPAKAGIQGHKSSPETLDSRLRGNDGLKQEELNHSSAMVGTSHNRLRALGPPFVKSVDEDSLPSAVELTMLGAVETAGTELDPAKALGARSRAFRVDSPLHQA